MRALAARCLIASCVVLSGACTPSLMDKHACRSDGDCLVGRSCLDGLCTDPGSAGASNDAGGGGGGTGGTDGSARVELYFAPHPDALLLFMNPDVENALRAGARVRMVYLTSGENEGGLDAAVFNEGTLREATAAMAGVADDWACAGAEYAGKPLQSCTLTAEPQASVLFLRLPDRRHVAGLWGRVLGSPPNVPPEDLLTTVDQASSYDRAQLIAALAAIAADFHPTLVGAPDGTTTYGIDHEDSVATGAFVSEALQFDAEPHELRLYRGYNVYQDWDSVPVPEDANLSTAEHDEKLRVTSLVDGPIESDDILSQWCWRRYAVSEPRAAGGVLRSGSGCLGVAQDGSSAAFVDCGLAPGWTVAGDHTLVSDDARCLNVAPDDAALVLSACDAQQPGQHWRFLDNGQLRGADSRCLSVGQDGSSMGIEVCASELALERYAPAAGQSWAFEPK